MRDIDALASFLFDNRSRPFVWGNWDCCLFAADAVLALTGVDHAATFRGRYRTERGARLALRKQGLNSVNDVLVFLLGEPQPIARLQRGDVVLLDLDSGETAGVLWAGQAFAAGENGLQAFPLSQCRHGWRIG